MKKHKLWTGLMAPGLFLLLGLFILPVLMLLVFSFGTTNVVGQPQLGATLTNYEQVFAGYNLAILGRTVLYALVATTLCGVIGYPYAYFAVRFGGKYGPMLIALVIIPWLVDYLVRIYAWRQILGQEGIVNSFLGEIGIAPVDWLGTPASVIMGLTYSYLPLMILPIYASLSDLDESIIDAGKDLYGNPFMTFWSVTWPASVPGVLGGTLLVFLPILGDFATAQFLGGPNTTMIGNIIADQFMQSGSATFGSALSMTMIAMLVVALVLVSALLRRQGKSLAGVM